MKIATWNIERLKHFSKQREIEQICAELEADILVLTETDNRITVGNLNCYESDTLPANCEVMPGKTIEYKSTERRVTIYSKHKIVSRIDTFDNKTALAVELELPIGRVIVYGVIIGILGNRDISYKDDLGEITADIKRISKLGNLVVCGDFNCSFSDGYYFTKHGREALINAFGECEMSIVTASCKECIDHIAIANELMDNSKTKALYEWNKEKNLSDHKGIMVEI